MWRKRKDGGSSNSCDSIWSVDDDDNSMMKLTKVAKSWDFTCSFCFKKFPSAQAMGGHQNAHRSERLEEKRLSVRDPIAYRKRAFLRAIKAHHSSSASAIEGGSSSFHAAATKMVKNNETAAISSSNSCFYQRWSGKESSVGENQKYLKELSLVESVDEREKACIHFDHNLDLTLKL